MFLRAKNRATQKSLKRQAEDREEEVPTTKKGPGAGRRGKSGITLDHSLLNTSRPKRERKLVVKEENEDEHECWNIYEKEKLLDALYRHSHLAYESISHVVKSKTPKQVEKFIDKMLNSSCLNYKTRVVELDPEKGAAPLELWLSLVQELSLAERKVDHSRHYTQILRVISQNESMPKESGFQDLDWRNLYQFMSDLLADKAVLQPLSNMESLVLLDMMHSMGDTLHTSDTTQQRRILDLKYQMFRSQIQNLRDNEFSIAYKAINNDFSSVDYKTIRSEASTSSSANGPAGQSVTFIAPLTASTASSSSQPQPSTSSQTFQILSSSSSTSVVVNSNNDQTIVEDKDKPSDQHKEVTIKLSNQHQKVTIEPSDHQEVTIESSDHQKVTIEPCDQRQDTSDTSTTTAIVIKSATNSTSTVSTTLSSTSQHEDGAKEMAVSENVAASEITTAKPFTATTSSSSNKEGTATSTTTTTTHCKSTRDENLTQPSSSSDLYDNDNVDEEGEEEEYFEDPLPKLFTLNPLTIPSSLLYLRPKNFSQQNDTPVIVPDRY